MNLATGDIMSNKKWKDYYQVDRQPYPEFGYFQVGTILGMLVDMDRGVINFFKDGVDLGPAFCQYSIKYGALFPFVQTHEPAELSIFHPFVYPQYRAPIPLEEQMKEVITEELMDDATEKELFV